MKEFWKYKEKVSDRFDMWMGDKEYSGYVPYDLGLGDEGDYIIISYCLDCGQIQGNFPVTGEEEAFAESE